MKKRILITTVTILLLFALSGCGAMRLVRDLAKVTFAGDDASKESDDSGTSDDEKKRPERESATPTPVATSDALPMDEAALQRQADRELADQFLVGEKRVFRIEDWKQEPPNLSGSEGQILYTGASRGSFFVLTREEDEYELTILSKDEDGRFSVGSTTITVDSGEGYLASAAVYKGYFYYSVKAYVNGEDTTSFFYYDAEGDAFLEDLTLEALYKRLIKDEDRTDAFYQDMLYSLSVSGEIMTIDREENMLYIYDETGFLKESRKYKTEDGYASFQCFDDRYLIYTVQGYDYENYRATDNYITIYDRLSDTEYRTQPYNDQELPISIIDLRDGWIYYEIADVGGSSPMRGHRYYRAEAADFDPISGAGAQLLCQTKPAAGFSTTVGAYGFGSGLRSDGFTVREDVCYYLKANPEYGKNQGTEWKKLSLLSGDMKEVATGAMESRPDFADYGFPEFSEDIRYDDAGKQIFGGYYENFVVADYVLAPEVAQKIAERLDAAFKEYRDYGNSVAEGAENDFAEWNADPDFGTDQGFSVPAYSYDRYYSGLKKIGAHYLQFAFDSYEYWGGAHGYPGLEFYLFDLRTGEEVTLAEVFPGTEEDFKTIVAEYSLADWKEGGYEKGYYSEYDGDSARSDEMYEDFYNSAGLEMLSCFTEDGITVMYYPYDKGPYASGFIGVDIPYEALGITLD